MTVIDGATNATATVTAGTNPRCGGGEPGDQQDLRRQLGSGTVTVIDGATNTHHDRYRGQPVPCAVAVNPVTNKIYVANYGGGNVTVIDGATNSTTTVTVGTGPDPWR